MIFVESKNCPIWKNVNSIFEDFCFTSAWTAVSAATTATAWTAVSAATTATITPATATKIAYCNNNLYINTIILCIYIYNGSKKRCTGNIYKLCRKSLQILQKCLKRDVYNDVYGNFCNCLQSNKHERSAKFLQTMKRGTRDIVWTYRKGFKNLSVNNLVQSVLVVKYRRWAGPTYYQNL